MNVKSRYEMRKIVLKILSVPMSFTGLWMVYIYILHRKFMAFGMSMYSLQWTVRPTTWMEIKVFWSQSILPLLPLLLIAAIADYWMWPYLFRRQQK